MTSASSGLRLVLNLMYEGLEANRLVGLAQRTERAGYHSDWMGEAYGQDAVTPLTWIAAHTHLIHLGTGIMQIAASRP
jgi:alkanesulfonate monooxygenase SsuD/methylene tetrahydromethanopterin reductase-like flavin-dependent oxidoreductase (luciferase family)